MLMMLPQLVVSGIATGMMYALIALSMTVVYRATTVVNFGHGDLVMAGAYAIFVFSINLALPFVPRCSCRSRCCSCSASFCIVCCPADH